MRLEAARSNDGVIELTMRPEGPMDMAFLTRLHKAMLLGDTIDIEISSQESFCYRSGAKPEALENLTWEPRK